MKIHNPATMRNNHGFSLIEALIAVVVLATGLLALTALQGALIRSSADAKARSLLSSYASSELERIRSDGIKNLTTPAVATMTVPGIGAVTKTITVTRYVGDTGTFVDDPTTVEPDTYYKDVNIGLQWTDATGQTRNLSMRSTISPLTLAPSDILVDRPPPSNIAKKPIVRRPTPVSEGMIPIALGNSEDTAATNPKPQLLGGEGGTYVSDTGFDVLTYNTADNLGQGGFVRFDKRIETRVLGCTCQNNISGFSGSGSGSGFLDFLLLKAFRPTYWDGRQYKEPAPASYAVDSSPAAVSQSPLCDICCRDHKDPSGTTGPKFSPWPGQDTAHYKSDLSLAGSNETYMEACRVIRVNGVFRVSADPKIQDSALIPTRIYPPSNTGGSLLAGLSNNNSATSPSVDSDGSTSAENGTTAYVNYVYNYIKQVFNERITLARSAPSSNYDIDVKAIQQDKGLNAPSYIPLLPSGDTRWMHDRILLVDYLEEDAIKAIEDAKAETATGSSCTGPSDEDLARCVLPYSPLATVNTTELSNWSPRAATTDDSIPSALAGLNLNLNYYNYARASIKKYNSGIALIGAINTVDGTTPVQDEQLFVRLSASPPVQPVWLNTPNPNPTTARLFGTDLSNPMRGYGQSSPPIPFRLSWDFGSGNPPSPVTTSLSDPTARVVGGSNCSVGSGGGDNTNPHTCSAPTTGATTIRLVGYNRTETSEVNNPCGSGKVMKPSCVVYTFTRATVNDPAATVTTSTLVSGTAGKKNEEIEFTVPGLNGPPVPPATTPASSIVTVKFLRSTPATTNTCSGTTPVWTVPCE